MLKDSLWIALGAVLGANLRYGVGRYVGRIFPVDFPLGTLLINITGSFILGAFFMWAREHSDMNSNWRLVVAVGFCGGYTTFSSFAWESYALIREGRWEMAALNIFASNVLGLMAVIAGAMLVSKFVTPAA
ncbi:MAG TPA: fluoride efflux transporter CrcB [Acidobacteriaceae bacterium]|nr:fluoride efflux transporter CrcB [Acidobacteriaceae bacterium]